MSDKAYDLVPTERSRELRNNATKAERMLWSALRNRKLEGVRFNRQVPIGPYICDFVARSVKLVVELDGGQHGDAVEYDAARTRFLAGRGYRVIRFWNFDVFKNLDGVIVAIFNAIGTRPSRRSGRGRAVEDSEVEGLCLSNEDMPSPPDACGVSVASRSGGRG